MATSRRIFLRNILASWLLVVAGGSDAIAKQQMSVFKGEDAFNRIRDKAVAENWCVLPIGELMGKISGEFAGTPYKGGTLELSTDSEICSVNLTAFDCVTFFETTLAFARMLKKGGRTTADLLSEVCFMRYRGGVAGDFTTRLHYTSDWFADNQKKGVVKLLDQLPGSKSYTEKINFMSRHVESYRQLAAHPELLDKIKHQEDTINRRSMRFVPLDKLAATEALLKTGDIVGLCTSLPGLDVTHTGLIYRNDGVAHFMEASSMKQKMKVTIEPGPITKALASSHDVIGIMFARPLEPTTTH